MTSAALCATCSDIRTLTNAKSCICPNGYYSEVGVAACKLCYYRCAECTTYNIASPVCTQCGSNRNTDATCSCPTGFYEQAEPNIDCGQCDSSCLTCDGPTASDCLTCPTIPTTLL